MKKSILKDAIKAAEGVVNREIVELINAFIEKLENERESVFDGGEDDWARKIGNIVLSNTGGNATDEEQVELGKAGGHAKSLLYLKLGETIEATVALRRTLGINK